MPKTYADIALAAPIDHSDIIDRTQPQSMTQKLSEKWFDAQVKYHALLQEFKNQLNPQSLTSLPTPSASPVTLPNYAPLPGIQPSPAMDQAMRNAGMVK